jgi:hypothetical protein
MLYNTMVRPIDVSWLPPRIDMHRYTTGISGISIVVATMRRPEKFQNFAPGGEEGVWTKQTKKQPKRNPLCTYYQQVAVIWLK